jgi:pimeloyl-ACP methyl ester carboxylesterase
VAVERFVPPYSEAAVADLRDRLARTRWPDEIPGSGWELGFDLAELREICRYWREEFDWRAQVERFSAFEHYRFTPRGAAGPGIHFIHARGQGPAPIPLVLTHGWPGSFVEMLEIIPLLADPARHGRDPAVSFDVVVPSLPGFAYSDRPAERGMSLHRIAALWVELMGELGYRRFGAQGGDFGASVTALLGLRHPDHLAGIHLNYIPSTYRPHLAPGAELLPAERAFLAGVDRWYEEHGAYAHLQRTTPQTAAYGLNDSPAGLAAWILEKFRDWADCGGRLEASFTRDQLLANVTLYWMTETIHSSMRLYHETRQAPVHFGPGEFVRVPCGIAHCPLEAPFPPREWIERGFHIAHWTDLPRGGHFAAAELPELLADDLREFFGGLGG